jgi:1,4-dihydroxy-2-naphthoyl-CoA synthase
MAINASVQLPLHQGEMFERAIFFPLFATEGAKEGVKAFIEKRKPDFTNK